jgi:ketosteroid isomerase-like protein
MSDTITDTDLSTDGVHEAHEAYVDAINSNETARFLLTVTDDIVFIPPNSEPIVGKSAVGAWVDGYFEAISTVWTKTTTELVVQGDLAYEWYRFRAIDTPRAGGEPTVDTGNGVNIYRLDTDGSWRVWRDIWAADH